MRFLLNHGEKVACAVIVVLCSAWAYTSLSWEPAKVQLPDLKPTSGDLSSFPYQPARLTAYSDQLQRSLAENAVGNDVYVTGAFYPQPQRPVVDTIPPEPLPPAKPGVFPSFAGLQVKSGHGKIEIACCPPQETKDFLPVRVELQRGASPGEFDSLIHCFELSRKSGPVRNAEFKEQGRRDGPRPGRARRVVEPEERGMTSSSAELRYVDTGLQAGGSYSYRARLVCRLVASGMTGVKPEDVGVGIPANVEQIPEGTTGETLYAGPWTSPVGGTVLDDLQIRYNFLSKGRWSEDPSANPSDCSVFLGLRLWDEEAQAWGESSLNVAVGQPVEGELKFTVGTNVRVRAFDSGLILEAVRRATKVRTEIKKELLTETREGENGEMVQVPVRDGKGNHQWIERPVIANVPTEVVILCAKDTDRRIQLVKGLGYEEVLPPEVKLVMEGEGEK